MPHSTFAEHKGYQADAAIMVQMRAVNSLIQAFEDDVKVTVASSVKISETVDQSVDEAIAAASEVEEQAKTVAGAAESALANVQTVAAATEELANSEHQLEVLMKSATDLAASAVQRAERASATVAGLLEASNAINGIVVFIETIARRTNMLALNATIEAQRAGAAGKGFAVVAGEVKDLAKQTADATRDIRDKIAGIRNSTTEASEAISSIGESVSAIHGINNEAAEAVQQQNDATREISRSAQDTTARVSDVTAGINMISGFADKALGKSDEVKKRSGAISTDLISLRERLGAVLKARTQGKQRLELPVDMACALVGQGRRLPGRLIRISPTGAIVLLEAMPDAPLVSAALDLPWLGLMRGTVQPEGNGLIFVRFDGIASDTAALLQKLIETLDVLDLWVFSIAAEGTRQVTDALAKAIDDGAIVIDDLFDEDYRPIPGSNPLQHMTRFVELTDRILPPIQEPLLARDKRLIAVIATDRNGYVPTNNLYCSKPQGSDPVWNTTHCRNRKILSIKPTIDTLLNKPDERYVLTSYIRQVSTGEMRMLRNLLMPVRLHGRFWGILGVTYQP